MKVRFYVGDQAYPGEKFGPGPVWPDGWPVPRIGDEVTSVHGITLKVTAVDWYPEGEDGDDEPYVYVVLRPEP